ncbi:MAG: tRNA guanosine(15) transglycosylase TgtA [archaeon]|nr:tRNA guanosine(15) transglycosylase TgtA [archaeon]
MFEILRRDGMARIGKFTTNSGRTVETPTLLPVINPKIKTVTPREIYEDFGFGAIITNSYIIKNNPALNEEARAKGLHEMLDFPGIIMTDSGTFQSHMYGEVEMTNKEIIEFQKAIRTDIGTVLDIFTEPYWTEQQTADSIVTTLERTEEAVSLKGEMMLNGVVQGSVYPNLRKDCAEKLAKMDIDVHPIGGVVPLMEQYRYSELVDVIMSSKMGLNPNRPVHLFGAGHPMLLAFATLMGCDLFDSASYAKFAKDDRMMFIDGSFKLAEMQSLDCNCPACRGMSIEAMRKTPKNERTRILAMHNLYAIKNELNLVKRYLREGRLWELAELRARAHPAMLDGLRRLRDYQEFMEKFDPISRDGAIFYTGIETRGRPVFKRYADRILDRYVAPTKKAAIFYGGQGKPYSRDMAEMFAKARKQGYTPVVLSPWGPVPAELDEMYPLAQSLFPDIEDFDTTSESEEITLEFLEKHFEETVNGSELEDSEGEDVSELDLDIRRAKAVARYQFGLEAADALFRGTIELRKSKKTGKIRNVISDGEHVLSMRAGDGMYTLRMEGAKRIIASVPAPHMRMAVTDDSVPFVSQGRNAMCQFTTACDENLVPMDEVIVVDKNDTPVATGRMLLVANEIFNMKKGIAVKIRSGSDEE